MKLVAMAFSVVYSLGQIVLGLLLHPYQTMQLLVEDRVFVWMSLMPMGVLAVVTLLWRLLIVPAVKLVFSCSTTPIWPCNYISFFSNTLTFFVLYWQIMLLYLLFRFSNAWRE